MPTIHEALLIAVRHHHAGQIDLAADIYQRVLAVDPGNADALHLLGVSERRRGAGARAIRCMSLALACNPQLADAYNNVGNALSDHSQGPAALTAYRRAAVLRPEHAGGHAALGDALRNQGQAALAQTSLRRALALQPDYAGACNSLGNALHDDNRQAAAEAPYRRALTINPDYPEALTNLGVNLRELGRLTEAETLHRQAIKLRPDFAPSQSSYGGTLEQMNRLDAAAAAQRRAIVCQPDFLNAYNNLANAVLGLNRLTEAETAYRRALTLSPGSPDAARNLGIALLTQGRLAEGWPLYEARWRCRDAPDRPSFRQPQWMGEPLEGRTILVYAEQGLGDTLHFCRYIPLIAARGGQVLLITPPELHQILAPIHGLSRLLKPGETYPPFDLHAPLLSLPLAFRSGLDDIPVGVPYLNPDPELAGAWGRRLADAAPDARLRVGLVWAGSPGHRNDRNRSIPLDRFAPLSRIPGVQLFSIQKGPAADALAVPDGMSLINLSPDIHNFADTAAIAAHLDLVICVDTSVAHLCGATARPTWVLLPFSPDWRWLLQREDSPWYPTLRLYRQPAPGDWADVMTRIERDVRLLAKE